MSSLRKLLHLGTAPSPRSRSEPCARPADGKEETSREVRKLIKALASSDPVSARDAAAALGQFGDDQAVDALSVALADPDCGLRAAAVMALGHTGAATAVQALLVALTDSDSTVRRTVAEALGQIGDLKAVPALVEALADADGWVRRTSAEALGALGWKPGRDTTAVRYWAALQKWDRCADVGPGALEPLTAALADRNSDVRRGAADALGRLGDRGAVDALVARLTDQEKWVRRTVVLALGRLGDPRVMGGLAAALSDPDLEVRWNAADALGAIGGTQALKILTATVLEDRAEEVLRLRAARVVGRVADAAHVRHLADQLVAKFDRPDSFAYEDSDGGQYFDRPRRDGAYLLGALGQVRAAECLVRWLDDAHSETREAAALALGAIAGVKGIDALARRAMSDDWCTHMGDPIGHPGHYTVRCAAVLALHRLDAADALSEVESGWPGAEAAAEEYREKRRFESEFKVLGYA
jgi:HEAT repeat protein